MYSIYTKKNCGLTSNDQIILRAIINIVDNYSQVFASRQKQKKTQMFDTVYWILLLS